MTPRIVYVQQSGSVSPRQAGYLSGNALRYAEGSNGEVGMSPGNSVNLALKLFATHWRTFAVQILLGYAWCLPGFLILLVGLGAAIAMGMGGLALPAVITGILGVGIGIWVLGIGLAQLLAYSAMLSRFCVQELLGQPESVAQAKAVVMPLRWKFLWNGLLLILLLMLIYSAIATVFVIVAAIAFGVAAAIESTPLMVVAGIIMLALFSVGLGIWLYFFCRWMIAEVPLALEPGLSPFGSIQRSWDLTQGSGRTLLLVSFITFLVTLPALAISSYIPQLFLLGLEEWSPLYTTIYALSSVLSILVNVLIVPFWQALKAVVYVDLRQRREGLGLSLSP
ncbi:MAG: hypothetical protein OHK0012_08190 [Synechococcales cyanobacterium]